MDINLGKNYVNVTRGTYICVVRKFWHFGK